MLRYICSSTLALLLTATANAASWENYTNTDEMRGTETQGAMLKVHALDDVNSTLTVNIINKSRTSQGVVFHLDSSTRIACKEKNCDVDVRFGDGSVVSHTMAVDADRKTLIPTESSSFAGSISLVNTFFVELPMAGGGRKQFKFEPDSPAFPRVYSPAFRIVGMALGGKQGDLPESFKSVAAADSVACREGKDIAGELEKGKISSARLCFFNGLFYMAFLESKNKADHLAIAKYLSNQLGPKEADSYMERWPADNGKVINTSTMSASYWPDPKVKDAGQFMVIDNAIADLVPK